MNRDDPLAIARSPATYTRSTSLAVQNLSPAKAGLVVLGNRVPSPDVLGYYPPSPRANENPAMRVGGLSPALTQDHPGLRIKLNVSSNNLTILFRNG